jgi:hypothetical protein
VLTILILFQTSSFRRFKLYYTRHVARHMCSEFPRLVSYNAFVESPQQALVPPAAFLHTRFGEGGFLGSLTSNLRYPPLPSGLIKCLRLARPDEIYLEFPAEKGTMNAALPRQSLDALTLHPAVNNFV